MKKYHTMYTRNKELVRRYEAGESGPKLAVRFGITSARVYQILNRYYLKECKV